MLSWNYFHWKIIFHLLLVNLSFLYPWKEQKLNVFVIFSWGIKREHWKLMNQALRKGLFESGSVVMKEPKVFSNTEQLAAFLDCSVKQQWIENWRTSSEFSSTLSNAIIVTGFLCWILHIKYCYYSPVYVYPLNILVEYAKCFFRTLK